MMSPNLFCESTHNRTTTWARVAVSACLILYIAQPGYAMQPPPAPLDLVQLRELVSEADIIIAGEILHVKETEIIDGKERSTSIAASLRIKKLLKGDAFGKVLTIQETYPTFHSSLVDSGPSDKGKSATPIIGVTVGPRRYHGRYQQGSRVIVLLAHVAGTDQYRPLGSGTFDKHLCEFLIEGGGIKALYFGFAPDMQPYVGSEETFINVIEAFVNSHSGKDE